MVIVVSKHIFLFFDLVKHVVESLVPCPMIEETINLQHLAENCPVIINEKLLKHQIDDLLWNDVGLVLLLYKSLVLEPEVEFVKNGECLMGHIMSVK